MSPRRSSRARTTQPTSSAQQHTNSSSSSISSSHADRSVRPENKLPSPGSSVAARSQSSQDPEAPATSQLRRTRGSQDDTKDQLPTALDDDNDEEVEEEVTRCICGNQEYPGLPDADPAKPLPKDEADPASFAEDTTGWFIQCDTCKVWQHGGCVGIMDEVTSPEEYFCERCRKDLHKITVTANGRKYSRYLPMRQSKSPQSSPSPATKENSKKPKDSRKVMSNADHTSKGRRSTMNSRDAAYEEEQLRRAIEESKREGGARAPGTTTGRRKGKRSRSESEERNENVKRQRTTSGSASSVSQSKSRRRGAESENEIEKSEKSKAIRGAAARNHRNKEVRDREAQRERERVDALSGRKGRAERRRGDESDPSPQPLSRTVSSRVGNTNNPLFAAPALPDHPPTKAVQRKTGRPPAKRGRVGRNQYTKDRDLPAEILISTISPVRSNNSHDGENGTLQFNGGSTGSGFADSNGFGKPSKPRHMNFNRTSMNDMKRRVAGILEFISHTQVEMAGVRPSRTKSSTSTNTPPESNVKRADGHGNTSKYGMDSVERVNAALVDLDGISEQAFAALSSVAMMEVLTRRLMKWQTEYGKWGEK